MTRQAAPASLDPRLHAYRPDLADARLRSRVAAPRYAEARPALVIAGRTPLRRAPEPTAPIDTFCHYGEGVAVFEEAGGYAWSQARLDDYVGYIAARDLAAGEAPGPAHFVVPLGAHLYGEPDLRSPAIDLLPRHSRAHVVEAGLVTRGTEYARLYGGGFVPLSCLSPTAPCSPDLAAAAALYLGCPYLWGGRCLLGLDCSGLVQQAFLDLGVIVARDTDLQRETIGVPVAASGAADLAPGDLIFQPGHVMIYAGAGTVIHADGATMQVRRDELARLMRARRLDFAAVSVRRCSLPAV